MVLTICRIGIISGGMKLQPYLKAERISEAKFGESIGVSQPAIHRYCKGRVPVPKIMRKIVAATAGKVTSNDFFEPPAAE